MSYLENKKYVDLINAVSATISNDDYLYVSNSVLSYDTYKVKISTLSDTFLTYINTQKDKYVTDSIDINVSDMVKLDEFENTYYYNYNNFLPAGSNNTPIINFIPPNMNNYHFFIITCNFIVLMNNTGSSENVQLNYNTIMYRSGIAENSNVSNHFKKNNSKTLINSNSNVDYPIELSDVNTNRTESNIINFGMKPTSIIYNTSNVNVNNSTLPLLIINNDGTLNTVGPLFSFNFNFDPNQTFFDYLIRGQIKIEVI